MPDRIVRADGAPLESLSERLVPALARVEDEPVTVVAPRERAKHLAHVASAARRLFDGGARVDPRDHRLGEDALLPPQPLDRLGDAGSHIDLGLPTEEALRLLDRRPPALHVDLEARQVI